MSPKKRAKKSTSKSTRSKKGEAQKKKPAKRVSANVSSLSARKKASAKKPVRKPVKNGAAKRGGSRVRVTFEPGLIAAAGPSVDLEALDEALTRLAEQDHDLAHLVEVRFFGGLSIEETAETLGVSSATVKRRWTLAKAWLARELGPRMTP